MGVASDLGAFVSKDQPRAYSDDEVEQILRRALQKQAEQEGKLGHEELMAVAREVGLDPSVVERTVGEVREQREQEKHIADWKARRKRRFAAHALNFLGVSLLLLAINLLTGGQLWFYWPVLFMAFTVAMHGVRLLTHDTPPQHVLDGQGHLSRKERRKLQARAKREARRQARARHREARRSSSRRLEDELEEAIEEGVHSLLRMVAKGIRGAGDVLERVGEDEGPVRRGKKGPSDTYRGTGPNVRVSPDDEMNDADFEQWKAEQRAREKRQNGR